MAENILGTWPVGKLIRKFSLPSIVALVVNAVYNIVDQIFIGNIVGYMGNSATNIIFPLVTFSLGAAMLIGDGTSAYMSLKLGAKDKEAAQEGVISGIVCLFFISILLGVIYSIFLSPICRLFGASDEVMPYAMTYGRYILIGVPFSCFAAGFAGTVRSDGSPKYSMMSLVVGCVLNVILDPLFMYVFKWGIAGAAIATAISQVVNAVIILAYIPRLKSVKFEFSKIRISMRRLPTVLKLGISSFINQFVIVILMAVQNNVIKHYGSLSVYGPDIPMAAQGITMKCFNILFAIVIGLASGAQPIWGYNYGSRQFDRVKKTYWLVVVIACSVLAGAWLIFRFAPMAIVELFGSGNELYNEFCVKCMQTYLVMIPLWGIITPTSILFQAVGYPLQSAIQSFSRQLLFNIPTTLLLPLEFGLDGYLYAGPLTDILSFTLAVVLMKLYWKKMFDPKTAKVLGT
ncbi:MAG: MATE family efflux transporter [Lachnospiraceae bacterium]|jgi:putative MATE family efflux protein